MTPCFSIWAECADGHTSPELDLHLNLWKPNRTVRQRVRRASVLRSNKHLLDIGIKFTSDTRRIFVYVPFFVDRSKLVDLGGLLSKQSVLNAVFNEDFSVLSRSSGKVFNVRDARAEKDVFSVYELDIESHAGDIELEYFSTGTILAFNVENYSLPQSVPGYIRFRITDGVTKALTTTYKPQGSFFQSAFSTTEIIDIRVNESRNTDKSLLQKMKTGSLVSFGKVHLFVLRDIEDNLVESHGSNRENVPQVVRLSEWNQIIVLSGHRLRNDIFFRRREGREKSGEFFAAVDAAKSFFLDQELRGRPA